MEVVQSRVGGLSEDILSSKSKCVSYNLQVFIARMGNQSAQERQLQPEAGEEHLKGSDRDTLGTVDDLHVISLVMGQ